MHDIEAEIPHFDTVFGRNLVAEVENFAAAPILVVTMEDLWPKFRDQLPAEADPYFVTSMEREALDSALAGLSHAASIVGLGGGQAIDAAKYFTWRTRLPLFQFPTSLSVDAVFGHRAGIREGGLVRYVGWAVPETIYVDYDVIAAAPPHINRAGIGDVLCFVTGVMDWRYASDKGKCEPRWPYDEDLAQVSLGKADAALAALEDIRDLTPRGIDIMIDALRWGGASYHGTGWNPRHIEGVEHYIFYALESLTGRKFLHGQAVCLGLIGGCMMHGRRVDDMMHAVKTVGVDIRPEAMGISWDDVDTAMTGLRQFVRRESLAWGIAHDFAVDDDFLKAFRDKVEGGLGS